VVVQEGARRGQVDSGQYLLDLDVSVSGGELSLLDRAPELPSADAEEWFNRGWDLEKQDIAKARKAYERALDLDPAHTGAAINLGRLFHEAGELADAERVYRAALKRTHDDPLLPFNLAVVLEDAGRGAEAIPLYEAALAIDPRFADCHYNLALAYEEAGNPKGAIRHLGEYRKLMK
jgi:tetratricopeptide (TPR) repeat protein